MDARYLLLKLLPQEVFEDHKASVHGLHTPAVKGRRSSNECTETAIFLINPKRSHEKIRGHFKPNDMF